MSSALHTVAGLSICSLCLGAPFVSGAATLGRANEDVTLTGCLVRGEGDGAGYFLTNASGEPSWQRPDDTRVQPGIVGTSGNYESVFYWLDDDDDLQKHVGHDVEIRGDVDSSLEDGVIELDRKERWTELTVKADGRTMKARVAHASVVPAPGDSDRKGRVLVRRVDVEKVEMLSPTCSAAR